MRVSSHRIVLSQKSIIKLQEAILECRAMIRAHRDARGDDRCWLDDYTVWSVLEDSPPSPTALPSCEERMRLCRAFYSFRRADAADAPSPQAIPDRASWDNDVLDMNHNELTGELLRVQEAVRLHRDITDRPRTIDDDRALYGILPEKIVADFRLPPEKEFLGRAKPHAGCPAFWRSHEACRSRMHNLHQWGPCS